MDERNSTKDILLAVILVIPTLVMVVRLWQDWIVALATGIMMISLAGLILSLCRKFENLENSVNTRDRNMRLNLEQLSSELNEKCDDMSAEVSEVVSSIARRMYR